MIESVHHISIIVSSEESVSFYKRLGFVEKKRIERDYDTVVLLDGHGFELGLFIDPTHPERATDPENIGLRHMAFRVDDIEKIEKEFDCGPVMTDWFGKKYRFTADPDGLPIEFCE